MPRERPGESAAHCGCQVPGAKVRWCGPHMARIGWDLLGVLTGWRCMSDEPATPEIKRSSYVTKRTQFFPWRAGSGVAALSGSVLLPHPPRRSLPITRSRMDGCAIVWWVIRTFVPIAKQVTKESVRQIKKYRPVHVSAILFIYPSIVLSFSLVFSCPVCLPVFLYPSVYRLPIYLSIDLSLPELNLFGSVKVHLSRSISTYLYLYANIVIVISLSIYLYLSIFLYSGLSLFHSTRLPFCPSPSS